jgi:hypothetical protein
MAFQLKRTDGNSTTWADPSDPNRSFRLKQTTSNKVLGGVTVENHVSEIIIGEPHGVTVEGVDAVDTLSVRLKVSGSVYSESQLLLNVELLCDTLEAWVADHYLSGFTPASVPALSE